MLKFTEEFRLYNQMDLTCICVATKVRPDCYHEFPPLKEGHTFQLQLHHPANQICSASVCSARVNFFIVRPYIAIVKGSPSLDGTFTDGLMHAITPSPIIKSFRVHDMCF